MVDKEVVRAAIDDHSRCLINTLSPDSFRGEDGRYGRPGRIPGSVNVPWPDLMRGFRAELEKFVHEFERAEALAPPAGVDLARDITRHEQALLEFVVRELDGREEDSLAPIRALLRA